MKQFWESFSEYKDIQFGSVTQSCPNLCDPMDHSMPGFTVRHQLPEFAETRIYRVGDAIQPSHPLPFPFSSCLHSFPASGSFPMSWSFANWLSSCSNSCPSSWWCHPTISSSVVPFSSCLHSFPASESFPMSWSFANWLSSCSNSCPSSWWCHPTISYLSFPSPARRQ